MYCPRCRSVNDNGSKYCSKCGAEMSNKVEKVSSDKKYNVLLIISFILSYLAPVVGLILSIISVVASYIYMRKTEDKVKYLGFGVAGIFISISVIAVFSFIYKIAYGR